MTDDGYARLRLLWEQLADLNWKNLDAVFFESDKSSDEFNQAFDLNALSLSADDLAGRLTFGKNLLHAISDFPVPCYFFGRGDCVGFFWELALACEQRFFFDQTSKVGCPEIELGFFPAYGIILKMILKKPHSDELQKHALKSAADLALSPFLVMLPPWVKNVDVQVNINPKKRALAIDGVNDGEKETLNLREKFTTRQNADIQSLRGSIDKILNPRLKIADDLNWSLAQILHLFRSKMDFDEKRWYVFIVFSRIRKRFRQFVFNYQKLNWNIQAVVRQPGSVLCDISEDIPNFYFLEYLMTHGCRPIFFADSAALLAHKLSLLRRMYGTKFSDDKVQEYFNDKFFWFSDSPKVVAEKIIFKKNNCIRLDFIEHKIEYFNMLHERDFEHARFFYFEKVTSSSQALMNRSALQILLDQHSFYFESQHGSLVAMIRSVFLYQILHVSRLCEQNLSRFLEILHYYGWGFSSRSHAWNIVLDSKNLNANDFKLFPEFLNYENFLSFLAKPTISDFNGLKLHASREQKITTHQAVRLLDYFALFLTQKLISTLRIVDPKIKSEVVSHFMTICLGLPLDLAEPFDKIAELGLPVIFFHLKKHSMLPKMAAQTSITA